MKYKLDCKESFESSFLFWLTRFVKYKLNSLSNKELQDGSALASVNFALTKGVKNIDELDGLVKKARNAGLTGINTYFNPLKKIYEVLKFYELTSLALIDEELISEVLASTTGNLSDATKKNYRIAVINFFEFIEKQNEEDGKAHLFDIELKNWGGITGNKGQKLPEFMSEDEVKEFLKAIDEADFKQNGNRNKLIIKLIIFTGIRVSEALNLKRKDLSEDGDLFIIRIRGKGNKYRVVMIKKHLIEEHLQNIAINYINQDGYLFVNKKGTKLTQAYISRIVEQILFKAGIRKEKNGAHMLRHTFATMLYKKQKDLVLVQEALGHASLNTSRIYTHFDSDKLKLAAKVAEDLNDR
ncbi:integrase [Campylobacter hyointestinalis subsp. hyointestinalis]|uniref:tyrosine-type recombinase/integrase n=1 Tax=Campylobacter hyointestinalis TaxID=198 RepID=UPI000729414C|nr:tyrosine-type recombinase/integrase [Campylobacter hyointestinalis]PPB58985.1 integrase [Campylobacter hyointestinalis subsp. hyointestinalis]QCU00002.1 integrase [Campylobacter hyointestinalis subsp. hyointestinalis]CUU71443.1 phage integrase family site specific recombinase [Campylobacter hyointestinalis subsp. hyointestinalis]